LIYLLISPYDNEKVDLLNIVKKNYGRELETNQQLGSYVTNLLSFDLIQLNEEQSQVEMELYEPFQSSTENNSYH
jgi:hypothetical protein